METRAILVPAIALVLSALIAAGASIVVAKSTVKSETTSLSRSVYDNGTVTSTSIAGGKMVVIVNGSHNGGPVSVRLDMARLESLCGDQDGCTVTLGATRFLINNSTPAEYVSDAPIQGAPCRFFYTKSKHWSLSQACVATFGLYKFSPQQKRYEFDRAYQIYDFSSVAGVDDSLRSDHVDPEGQAQVILGFKGACYLSEAAADVRQNNGRFLPDDPSDKSGGLGLFLTASSPLWDYPGVYPKDDQGVQRLWPASDPARQCILIVED